MTKDVYCSQGEVATNILLASISTAQSAAQPNLMDDFAGFSAPTNPAPTQTLPTQPAQPMMNLMSQGDADRAKRGRYVKLSEDVQREIVEYARQTGSNSEAARVYSDRLGCQAEPWPTNWRDHRPLRIPKNNQRMEHRAASSTITT